jgi:hypothetical protein
MGGGPLNHLEMLKFCMQLETQKGIGERPFGFETKLPFAHLKCLRAKH